ncbi:MAG: SpoIIE family protein phosphatase [Planctomycetes bacterium]|nr:SpoIIE family protein phosphatase [Planctomycetota bacterium]
MPVVCSLCGETSQDVEFCDHCNADLKQPSPDLPNSPCPLPKRDVDLTREQRESLRRPEAWIKLDGEDKAWRVHWIARNQLSRWLQGLRTRQATELPCLAPCRVVEQESGAWVMVEANGSDFTPWSLPPSEDVLAHLNRLLAALAPLCRAVETLHATGLVWLNFDPTFVEQMADGELRILNLDLALFRSGQLPEELSIQTAFAAPEITGFLEKDLGPATDVFHLAMFAYYWIANLLPEGFPGAGLDAFAHQIPPLRVYRPDLSFGIAPVLERGVNLAAADRWAGPRDFLLALQDACSRATNRKKSAAPIQWEIGQHTRTGRSKDVLCRSNEDHVLVRAFTAPARALLAVADGVSTCDIGSGALASLITTVMVENSFQSGGNEIDFPHKITEVCGRAARTLVDWALEKGYRDQLLEGTDLMGTTLLAGWLEGRHLELANMGDSRAYLYSDAGLEQLTVDGDLGSGMLAAGTPPEEVRELGSVAKALRECIGGCSITPEGEISVLDENNHPAVSRWPLLPGDIVILCSDGLVEEGAFLEPAALARLVRAHRQMPADKLAVQLSDAADALQRLPSALEPEGHGDNITCIVVKIEAAR